MERIADNLPETRSSPLRSGAARVFSVGAWIFAAGIAAQVYLAGMGILVDPSYFGWHVTFAHLLESVLLVLIVAGLLGKVGWNALGWTGLLFLLYGLQYASINGFDGPLRGLHAVNALLMFLIALHLGRRQWRVIHGLPANSDGPMGDRFRRNAAVTILLAVPAIMLVGVLTPDSPVPEAEPPSGESSFGQTTVVDARLEQGARIYADRCSSCHGEDGEGGFGPGLAGGEVSDARATVRQILHGSGGMPAFRERLSDEQIASVASFVGTSWGNETGPVGAELVEESR